MQYPKIRHLGHDDNKGIFGGGHIVILEKLDGANFRMQYHPETDDILFGSRRTLFKEYDEPAPLDRINKQFRHAVKYVSNQIDMEEIAAIHEEEGGVWLFGESLHKHRIDYDAWDGKHPDVDSDTPNVLGFDIYSENRGRFLPHSEVEDTFERLGLQTVPVIDDGPATEFDVDELTIPRSKFRTPDSEADVAFNRDGLAEGVVIKNTERDLRAKFIADDFAEHSLAGKPPSERREINSTAAEFVHRYVADARVEKQAHKLIDEGRYDDLKMEMMRDLPRRVAEDVMAEHGWEILNDDEIELTAGVKDEIRSRLSKKCSRVLRQMMKSRAT